MRYVCNPSAATRLKESGDCQFVSSLTSCLQLPKNSSKLRNQSMISWTKDEDSRNSQMDLPLWMCKHKLNCSNSFNESHMPYWTQFIRLKTIERRRFNDSYHSEAQDVSKENGKVRRRITNLSTQVKSCQWLMMSDNCISFSDLHDQRNHCCYCS